MKNTHAGFPKLDTHKKILLPQINVQVNTFTPLLHQTLMQVYFGKKKMIEKGEKGKIQTKQNKECK